MHDAGVRRHDLEVGERVLAPAQERVALLVTRELEFGVELHGAGLGEGVDLQRVIDDQLGRRKGINLFRVVAERAHGIAHGGQIHHRGYAGEIL